LLHICHISQTATDSRGEWVSVCNEGTTSDALTGLELTDYTKTQQQVHVYRFPTTTSGTNLMLGPGQVAYVFTGKGRSEWIATKKGNKALLLFAGRSAPVWNNTGDVAYLRKTNGQFVDSKTVGSPARHPNGH
jgi:Lamin Tail Domain